MYFFPSIFSKVCLPLLVFYFCQSAENTDVEAVDMALPAHILRQTTREERAYALERHIQSRAFGLVYVDVFCTDEEPLTHGQCPTLKRCKERCQESEPKCEYFAWWPEEYYCETYPNCKHTTLGNENETIEVFKRLNDCEMEIVHMPNYYMRNIIDAFPQDIVRHPYFDMLVGKTPNFECRCIASRWMICMINVRPGSQEELLVQQRLKRDDAAYLLPFYTMHPPVMSTGPEIICYDETSGRGRPKVIAEIEVIHPDRCIPLAICRRGSVGERCPIQDTQFQSGDPVYIESRHVDLVKRGEPVPCVSVAGVRAVAAMAMDEIPEGRNIMYFIFDEAKIAEGICQHKSDEELIALKAEWLGHKKKSKKMDQLAKQFQAMSTSQAGPSSDVGHIPPLQTRIEMSPEERRRRREEQKRRENQSLQESEDADASHSSTSFHSAADEGETFPEVKISLDIYKSSMTHNKQFLILFMFSFVFVIFLRKDNLKTNRDELHIAFLSPALP